MNVPSNDPRITAYILGEMDDAERDAFELELEQSIDLRAAVQDLRELTGVLKEELGAPGARLHPEQRARIERAAAPPVHRIHRVWAWSGAGAVAAALVVGVVLLRLPTEVLTRQEMQGPERIVDRAVVTQDARQSEKNVPAMREEAPSPLEESQTVEAPIVRQFTIPSEVERQGESARASQAKSEATEEKLAGVDVAAAPPQPATPMIGGQLEARRSRPPGSGESQVGYGVVVPATAGLTMSDDRERDRLDSQRRAQFNTEAYAHIADNPFIRVADDPRSTFSIDVDTASYSNVRRFLNTNQLPPRDAVRIEELLNYFTYNDPPPRGEHPVAVTAEVAPAPWNPSHQIARVALKAREIDPSRRPASNLVMLIDVSGSMNEQSKLPLLKAATKLLVDHLGENDRVSIVVYAGASGLALPPTRGDRREVIHQAIERLSPGGSTNGAAGIQLAYQLASDNFIRGGTNRVLLMTDGDFNVGVTSQGDLVRLIESKAKTGVFLSVLGFGMGNLKDSTMESLADKGNGNYAYVDTIREARKVLVEQMGSTLQTVAKDVKLQLEFNPAEVQAFRLIGYENRLLRHQDFNDDTRDAGEMGSGHTVTALYELVPTGASSTISSVDPLKYQRGRTQLRNAPRGELLTVKLRYKLPEGDQSRLLELPVQDRGLSFDRASDDLRFAASVAAFGMILRDSPHKGRSDLGTVLDIASGARGPDRGGYRAEFLELVRRAQRLSSR